jgi:hypothetical protein
VDPHTLHLDLLQETNLGMVLSLQTAAQLY